MNVPSLPGFDSRIAEMVCDACGNVQMRAGKLSDILSVRGCSQCDEAQLRPLHVTA